MSRCAGSWAQPIGQQGPPAPTPEATAANAYTAAVPGFRHVVALVAAILVVATTNRASAQALDTDRQIAQQLFDDGRTLLEARRYPAACLKFAESQRLDPGGGTLLNLAYCHELEGKTATAWAELRDALGQAIREDRKDREDFTRAHIADLAPRLMRVVIQVSERLAARDPELNIDRSKLPAAAWDTPIPVDPGEHQVTVSVRGTAPWTVVVNVSEPGTTYAVKLDSPEGPSVCPDGQMRVEGGCAPVPSKPIGARRTAAFWGTLGGAGTLLVTSAVTGIVALRADAYVADNCSAERDFCRVSDAGEAATRARTFAWVSTATLAASGLAALVAFVLPREPTPARAASFITLGFGSLQIRGM